jgi:hypothetical protein
MEHMAGLFLAYQNCLFKHKKSQIDAGGSRSELVDWAAPFLKTVYVDAKKGDCFLSVP